MPSWTFDALARESLDNLETVLQEGTAPAFSSLVGWEFRGYNVLAPIAKPVMLPMGFTRFAKGFYTTDKDTPVDEQSHIRGYNVMIQRGGLTDDWVEKPSPERPKRHGFYKVYPAQDGDRFTDRHDHALYLNYNVPDNSVVDGRGIRDFVVQVDADNPDLLLGKAFFQLGPLRVKAGFFILERWREYDFSSS